MQSCGRVRSLRKRYDKNPLCRLGAGTCTRLRHISTCWVCGGMLATHTHTLLNAPRIAASHYRFPTPVHASERTNLAENATYCGFSACIQMESLRNLCTECVGEPTRTSHHIHRPMNRGKQGQCLMATTQDVDTHAGESLDGGGGRPTNLPAHVHRINHTNVSLRLCRTQTGL